MRQPRGSYSVQLQRFFEDFKIPEADFSYFADIGLRRIDPYTSIKIEKSGRAGSRAISIPDKSLSLLHSKILERLELYASRELQNNLNAFAYIKGRSHADAAEMHLGMRWGIKVDISRFFDHITETHVERAFRRLGFSRYAMVLAKLCTRVGADWPLGLPAKYTRYKRAIDRHNLKYDKKKFFRSVLAKYPRFVSRRARHYLSRHGVWQHRAIVLPPKRIPRIYSEVTEAVDSRKDILWPIIQRSQIKYSNFQEKANWLSRNLGSRSNLVRVWSSILADRRWHLRKSMLKYYESPEVLSKLSSNKRQKFYQVRPSQYRLFRQEGHLPQGASTSGFLSNLVMMSFDEILSSFCNKNGLTFTRYSDDIVISSKSENFSRPKALEIISFVQKLCEVNGFTLNRQKTRILSPGSRKFVLGLLVDGNQLRLGKFEKQNIEKAIYQLGKFGNHWLDSQETKHQLNSSHFLENKRMGSHSTPNKASDPLESLLGWIAYCKRVDRAFLARLESDLWRGKWHFEDEEIKRALIKAVDTSPVWN